jgi:hypothetical protein
MPRFVLLHHECPPGYVKPSHWDFMLEFDPVLWTWELRRLPAAWNGDAAEGGTLTATRLADHRIDFLDFEGQLTGDRGSVRRLMEGEFEVLENTTDRLRVRLAGRDFAGDVQLTATSQRGHWLLELID